MFKHPDIYEDLIDQLKEYDKLAKKMPFVWSDELAYSAAKFVDGFYGCTIDPDLIAHDGNDHDYLKQVATFQNHIRLNFVPARYPWSSPKEAVLDWLLDDDSFGFQKRLHLLSNTFT